MYSFIVEPDGEEPYEITTGLRDIRKWEKETGKSAKDLNADNIEPADIFLIAYYASVRLGKFSGTLDEFEDTVDFEMPEVAKAPLASDKEASTEA